MLLLIGTGLSGTAYVASQKQTADDEDSNASTQPSDWDSGGYGYHSYGSSHYYGHSYFSGGGGDDDTGFSHSFSGSTEHGGFGSTGHAHASASS
jgi:hypothetical protein